MWAFMSSGRKERIMIACVTFETVKITDPALYYKVDTVHLIHYVSDKIDSSKKDMYGGFYSEVEKTLKSHNIEVKEHTANVNNFTVMLRLMLTILRNKPAESEVYVNVSAGTSEYSAAAVIASMMNPGTIPYSVGTKEYTIGADKIDLYYDGNKPVGLTKATYEPRALPTYTIDMPPEYLVRSLRILSNRLNDKMLVSARYMVAELKENGLWLKNFQGDHGAKKENTDAVNYSRDYIAVWTKNGLIVKDELTKKPKITAEGSRILDTFYVD